MDVADAPATALATASNAPKIKAPIIDDEYPVDKPPRKIGKYEIHETLGKGGYSWVKRGVDTETGATVALKFMARAQDEWAVEQADQVRTEIKSLTQIRHANVMRLFAYNLSAKYPTVDNKLVKTILLVLEYCPGGEIFDILYYSEVIDRSCARTYLHQMIDGLDACHLAGVAHRDIKPQNLLLDSDFQLKITDFGLSKVIESDGDFLMRTTYVGTRGYQAPELLNNRKYTNSCDIFSMGVVVFIMLCGYPPFERAHKSDRWYKPLCKTWVSDQGDTEAFWRGHRGCGIPEECKSLITGMLCYKPSKRITLDEIREHPFWSNGKVLEKAELKKRIMEKYAEAQKARVKDVKKMKDLEKSISRASVEAGALYTKTPVLLEGARPRIQYFYTPISRAPTRTMLMVRKLFSELFGATFTPAAYGDSPYEFMITIGQLVQDQGDKKKDRRETHKVAHTIRVFLRRDEAVKRHMVYFSLIRTEERVKWIKFWRQIFNAVRVYGLVADDDQVVVNSLPSMATYHRAYPREEEKKADDPEPAEAEGEEPVPALPPISTTKSKGAADCVKKEEGDADKPAPPAGGGMLCGAGGGLCGSGALAAVDDNS